MSDGCIFCRIVAGEVPAQIVAQSDRSIAIVDRTPQAPVHVLAIPRRHAAHLTDFVGADDAAEIADLLSLASRIGREHGTDGYRLVVNEGADGGQTVDHLHIHVIAGRSLGWPPG